jgi:toxin ParE1/3/4
MPSVPSSQPEPQFTDAAIADLDDIEKYISRGVHYVILTAYLRRAYQERRSSFQRKKQVMHPSRDSPLAASQFIQRLREVCNTLAAQPFMGRARPELAPSMRSFPIGNYIIYYRPLGDAVEIMRVYHGSRDIRSLFRQM